MGFAIYEIEPLIPAVKQEGRLHRRDVDAFLGLVRGVVSDGHITDDELRDLDRWIANNRRLGNAPLVEEICAHVKRASSNPADQAVRTGLQDAITRLIGQLRANGQLQSTTLPFEIPLPPVIFPGNSFCFTGTFKYGKRTFCEEETAKRGGNCRRTVAQNVDYLVIGETATGSWLHSSYGTKIQDAVHWRKTGASKISIIPESHWVAAL